MAQTPMQMAEDGILSTTNTVTNASNINAQLDGSNMNVSNYTIVGAQVTGGYVCLATLTTSNNWRIRFYENANDGTFISKTIASGTVTIWYKKS